MTAVGERVGTSRYIQGIRSKDYESGSYNAETKEN